MTIFSGRVVWIPGSILPGAAISMAFAPLRLHVAFGAQALEGILGLVVHRSAGAFGDIGMHQLVDDRIDGIGVGFDREGDVLVAERTVAFTIFGEVKRN